jgi:hypothetical protein
LPEMGLVKAENPKQPGSPKRWWCWGLNPVTEIVIVMSAQNPAGVPGLQSLQYRSISGQVNTQGDSTTVESHGEWQFVECAKYWGGSVSKFQPACGVQTPVKKMLSVNGSKRQVYDTMAVGQKTHTFRKLNSRLTLRDVHHGLGQQCTSCRGGKE